MESRQPAQPAHTHMTGHQATTRPPAHGPPLSILVNHPPNSVMCTDFSVRATPAGPPGISLTSGISMGWPGQAGGRVRQGVGNGWVGGGWVGTGSSCARRGQAGKAQGWRVAAAVAAVRRPRLSPMP